MDLSDQSILRNIISFIPEWSIWLRNIVWMGPYSRTCRYLTPSLSGKVFRPQIYGKAKEILKRLLVCRHRYRQGYWGINFRFRNRIRYRNRFAISMVVSSANNVVFVSDGFVIFDIALKRPCISIHQLSYAFTFTTASPARMLRPRLIDLWMN